MSNEPYVHNAFILTIYGSILVAFPLEHIFEFWREILLTIEGITLTEKEKFEHLWNIEKTSPQIFINKVLLALEPFFIRNGKSIMDFWAESAQKGCAFEPRSFLFLCNEFIPSLAEADDLRAHILKCFPAIGNATCINSFNELDHIGDDSKFLHALYFITSDITHSTDIPVPDHEVAFIAPSIYLPVAFGLKPFEGYAIHSEPQPVFDRIDSSLNPHMHSGRFFIGDVQYGRSVLFSRFLKEHGFAPKQIKPPDKEVIIIEKNYFCPVRKRIILKKGCAYGAPMCTVTIHCRRQKQASPNPLRVMSDKILYRKQTIWDEIEQKDQALLKLADSKAQIRFNSASCAISINAKHITSGTQAKILRKIIATVVREGRNEFERSEFITDEELISSDMDTGFSIRLKRINTSLSQVSPVMSIIKTSRGKFRFESKMQFDFKEE